MRRKHADTYQTLFCTPTQITAKPSSVAQRKLLRSLSQWHAVRRSSIRNRGLVVCGGGRSSVPTSGSIPLQVYEVLLQFDVRAHTHCLFMAPFGSVGGGRTRCATEQEKPRFHRAPLVVCCTRVRTIMILLLLAVLVMMMTVTSFPAVNKA